MWPHSNHLIAPILLTSIDILNPYRPIDIYASTDSAIMSSVGGLMPDGQQADISKNAGLLLILPRWTRKIKIKQFSSKKLNLKM